MAHIGFEASRDQDRAVLTLSGGALVLSVTFLSDVFAEPDHLWSLRFAWALLLLSVLAMLLSYETSRTERNNHIDEVDAELRDPRVKAPPVDPKRTRILNRTAVWGLVLGLALLAVFAAINL